MKLVYEGRDLVKNVKEANTKKHWSLNLCIKYYI